MNYAQVAIRRALFYLVIGAVMVGITQVGVLGELWGQNWFNPRGSGHTSTSLLWLLGILLLLVLGTTAVMLRGQRLERAESRLRLAPGLDRQLFEHAPAGMLLSSVDGRVQAVNSAYGRLTEFGVQELLGRDDDFQKAGSLAGSQAEQMALALKVSGKWRGQLWVRKPSGEALGFRASRIALTDGERRVLGYLTLCEAASNDDDAQRLMLWQAHHDTLTKLPNTNLFQARLTRFLATQSSEPLDDSERPTLIDGAVLSVSLDGFTMVNDSMGFAAGDQVLMEAGHRIALTVRETDTVARLGGDQFAVLLTGVTGDAEVALIASRLVSAMSEPFVVDERELFVTASVGVLGFTGSASP